eukprot:2197582-Rhodomonas_salina.1
MDYVKDVGDKLHDAIQQSVDRKSGDGTGMRTPQVASTPATAMSTHSTKRVNPSGPEQGDISSLQDAGSSSTMARDTASLTVLSLDDPTSTSQWKKVCDAGDDPMQTIKAIMKGAKKRVLINELGPKWNDPASQGKDNMDGFHEQILAGAASTANMTVCLAVQDVLKRSKDCASTQGVMTKNMRLASKGELYSAAMWDEP